MHAITERLEWREAQLGQALQLLEQASEEVGSLQQQVITLDGKQKQVSELQTQIKELVQENKRLEQEREQSSGVFGENFTNSFLELQVQALEKVERELSAQVSTSQKFEFENRRLENLVAAYEDGSDKMCHSEEKARTELMALHSRMIAGAECQGMAEELIGILDRHLCKGSHLSPVAMDKVAAKQPQDQAFSPFG
eukprot:TRINITY_DN4190_c0_g1_i4.p1 TRINITY_DN4190_c0_g1~~TRINITY_DN4190_c0_g1_i4.p1  ORF type:complete len:196 (-),score=69.96 TRINITY_DN4190_c0_g1_i4:239-826(-)